jgi:hypothetical protein
MKYILRRLLSIPVVIALVTFSMPSVAQILLPDECIKRVTMFDFLVESIEPTSVKQTFIDKFCAQVPKVEAWAAQQKWQILTGPPQMKILIGDHFHLGRSLVPAWEGDRGRVEFPKERAMPADGSIRADIAHEVFHVYFPNGNRMLAEGIAIYVQDETATNPAYPNWGKPVHQRVFCALHKHQALDAIDLSKLDAFATPQVLTLDLPPQYPLQEKHRLEAEQQAAYLVAGSFVRYLIDTYTMDKFRNLYERTAFEAKRYVRRDAKRDDWTDSYARSLSVLDREWKTMISGLGVDCPSSPAEAP